ncbi:MAG: VanW family protein, partial [Thermomicrobiales bacterium]
LDAVGQITVDAGFVEGKIISGGWYATDIGGGVCQVSTTVYRAALLAGLPFAEWHPHSVRVSFYELDGWPVGMDATVFQPETPDAGITLDLVITNPTDSWILLQMTTNGDELYADLYGADTGYTVQISDPVISDETTPGPALEKDDPDLAKGERQQTQTAQDGFTTTMTRTVTLDGDVVLDESFISVYNPVSDAFMVGTG